MKFLKGPPVRGNRALASDLDLDADTMRRMYLQLLTQARRVLQHAERRERHHRLASSVSLSAHLGHRSGGDVNELAQAHEAVRVLVAQLDADFLPEEDVFEEPIPEELIHPVHPGRGRGGGPPGGGQG